LTILNGGQDKVRLPGLTSTGNPTVQKKS